MKALKVLPSRQVDLISYHSITFMIYTCNKWNIDVIQSHENCTTQTFSRPLNQPFIRIIQIKFPIYIFSALDCECCFARLKFQKTKHHVDTEKNQRLKAKCTAEFVLRKQTKSIISWKKKLFILWSTQRAKITHGYNKFRRNNLDEIYMLCSSLNLAPEGTNEEKKKHMTNYGITTIENGIVCPYLRSILRYRVKNALHALNLEG